MKAFNFIEEIKQLTKSYALLIDPDKYNKTDLVNIINIANQEGGPDFIFVGGSLLFNDISDTIKQIKLLCNKPILVFPGNPTQVSPEADGILFLSLISGRNPEYLIGNHVLAAPKLKSYNIDITPTGYILINCGTDTSVSYISNTTPIPYTKNDIAISTAIAGEMLGLKCIYLEGGSGAFKPIAMQMIEKVKSNINIPLIVGGGIKTATQFHDAFKYGADLVVIGNAIEENPDLLHEMIAIKKRLK